MNRKQRRAGTPCPPREGLICRSEAMLILNRSRRSTFRYERDEILIAVLVDDHGNKWFELESVMRLAARLALEDGAGHASREATVAPPPTPQVVEGDYHPELRTRRTPRGGARHASRKATVAPPPTPQVVEGDYRPELRTPRGETPKSADNAPRSVPSTRNGEEKPLPPSVQGAIAIRPTTAIDPKAFEATFQEPPFAMNSRRSEEKPLPPSVQGAVAIRPTTQVDPTWFNDDFEALKGGGSKAGGSK